MDDVGVMVCHRPVRPGMMTHVMRWEAASQQMHHCTIYYWWRNVCVHCKTPEAVLTHPSIHMKTTFADVEPNPAIVCVVGPAVVVTFSFNSRQAAVGGAVLAPGGGFLAWATCPSYNPNPNTSIVFLIGVSLAWYFVHCGQYLYQTTIIDIISINVLSTHLALHLARPFIWWHRWNNGILLPK